MVEIVYLNHIYILNDFLKDFFKLMNNEVFGKLWKMLESIKISCFQQQIKNIYLLVEPNYHTTKMFLENSLPIEMKKTKTKMNTRVYLGLSILDISKTLMYEFCYDYIKPKYQHDAKLCYMDTDSFIIHIKTEDIYEEIANDVEKRFDASNYEVNISLPTGKNKKVIGLMKDELGKKDYDRICRAQTKHLCLLNR